MKKYIVNICLAVSICFVMFSCKKEPIPVFNERAGIHFVDSMSTYTFIDFPGKKIDTVKITAELFGKRVGYDRKFDVSLVTDDTTRVNTMKEGTYKILDCILPADSLRCFVPIEVKYFDEMDKDVFKLHLKIDANEEFPNVAFKAKKIRVEITNKLIQPSNWNNHLRYYFGMTYSTAWYKFILGVFKMGYVPYYPNSADTERYYMGESQFMAYVELVRDELKKYNDRNPKDHLKHDDGTGAKTEVQM